MKFEAPVRSLFDICTAEYARLKRELYRGGLDVGALDRTRQALSEIRDGRAFLKVDAYRPTGLALGRPLPQGRQRRRLFRLACLVEARLTRLVDSAAPAFAHVPPAFYHITVVNRTHYEFTSVEDLQPEEKAQAEKIISDLGIDIIQVVSYGLLLTRSGRLLLECLPVDDQVLHLRGVLTRALPQFAINVPKLVHVKLGHVMAPLTGSQLDVLELCLRKVEIHACFSMSFSDLYTPLGRISF